MRRTPITLTQTKYDAIDARLKSLTKRRKEELAQLVRQSYRVVDTRDADKYTLRNMLLKAEFGQPALEAYDAKRIEKVAE